MWRQLSCLWHYLYVIYFSNERPKYKLMETDNLIFLTLLGWGWVVGADGVQMYRIPHHSVTCNTK